ncbi:hypothetical protein PIB30_108581 [Stylosanthes scabra]|uniref:Uncharacterized protein n=1 Tax=Stylosanthes scabra TaxID=79078 RepID=A0ABU6V286_9FABA|nr:hypothetical protein [Stylosanthes scabra]
MNRKHLEIAKYESSKVGNLWSVFTSGSVAKCSYLRGAASTWRRSEERENRTEKVTIFRRRKNNREQERIEEENVTLVLRFLILKCEARFNSSPSGRSFLKLESSHEP